MHLVVILSLLQYVQYLTQPQMHYIFFYLKLKDDLQMSYMWIAINCIHYLNNLKALH